MLPRPGAAANVSGWSPARQSGQVRAPSEPIQPDQRRIVATIEYLVDDEDADPDLRGPTGFDDDLHQLHQLQEYLGYV